MRVSRLPTEDITMFLREIHLVCGKGVRLKSLSDALHFRNLPEMLSALLRVGTPGSCLWQGDLGEELDLLATILRQSIISFSSDALRSNTGRRILDSDIAPLNFSFCYNPYPSVPINSPIYPFHIPILHVVNQFKALVPPHNYDLSELRRFLPR